MADRVKITAQIQIDLAVDLEELPQLRRDWEKMDVIQFISVWGTEVVEDRVMVTIDKTVVRKEMKDGG